MNFSNIHFCRNFRVNRISSDIENLANVMNSIVQKLEISTQMIIPDEDNQEYANMHDVSDDEKFKNR